MGTDVAKQTFTWNLRLSEKETHLFDGMEDVPWVEPPGWKGHFTVPPVVPVHVAPKHAVPLQTQFLERLLRLHWLQDWLRRLID